MANPIFTAADLPIVPVCRGERNVQAIYHLEITGEELADNIILCGDPGRATALAGLFLKKFSRFEHRGLVTCTGKTESGLPLSFVTTGMGTSSTEIVIMELFALAEIDLATRQALPPHKRRRLNLVRVGTSGALQPNLQLGVPVIAESAVGLDASGLYYPAASETHLPHLTEQIRTMLHSSGIPGAPVYAVKGDESLHRALVSSAKELDVRVASGITVSAPGFFFAQGRTAAHLKPLLPDLDRHLSELHPDLLNFEMEASLIFRIAAATRFHRAGAICATVAHRPSDTFADPQFRERSVLDSARIAIAAFESL